MTAIEQITDLPEAHGTSGSVQTTYVRNSLRSLGISALFGNGCTSFASVRSVLTIPDTIRAARIHCQPSCFAEHASERLLQQAGMKNRAGWYAPLYRRALHNIALPASGRIRVLIYGAPDEALLATLATLVGSDLLDAHQVDPCGTPLHLAAAYAQRHGIELVCDKIRTPALPPDAEPYDLIAMDGLLSVLRRSEDGAALLRRMSEPLTPGGLVVYTAQVPVAGGDLAGDRLVRLVEASVVRAAWPGSRRVREDLARAVCARPPRRSPFCDGETVRQAFADSFGEVQLYARRRPLSVVSGLTARWQSRAGIGVVARTPRGSS